MSIIHCKDITFFDKTNIFFQRKERRTNPPSYLKTLKMLIYILPLSYIQNLPNYSTYLENVSLVLCPVALLISASWNLLNTLMVANVLLHV